MAVIPYREEMTAFWRRIEADERRRLDEEPKRLNLSALSASQKRALWDRLKADRPDLVAALQDPVLQALRTQFDAAIVLPRDLVEELLDGP